MKISIWLTSTTRPMSVDNIYEIPLGGAEISAVNLGAEFIKRGHDLTYYVQRSITSDSENLHIRYHHQAPHDEHDYFICVRPHIIIDEVKANKKVLWSGDAYDQRSNEMFFEKVYSDILDALVFKSEWQKRKILEKFPLIDPSKTHVIYNGVKGEIFENLEDKVQANRFIHASTWYRGVHNFVYIWPRILEKLPDAEIHVFSKTSLYSEISDSPARIKVYEDLSQLPNFILREPIPQRLLAREMRKSWLMLYPNSVFVESSCGAVMQSIGAGTPVVTTKRAGLIETVGNDGLLIEETEDWKDKFVEGVLNLCTNKEKRNQLGKQGRERILGQNLWTHKADQWLDFLKSL